MKELVILLFFVFTAMACNEGKATKTGVRSSAKAEKSDEVSTPPIIGVDESSTEERNDDEKDEDGEEQEEVEKDQEDKANEDLGNQADQTEDQEEEEENQEDEMDNIEDTAEENLVKNPSFELGEDDWTIKSGTIIPVGDGNHVLEITQKPGIASQEINIEPLTNYTISVWFNYQSGSTGTMVFDTNDVFDGTAQFTENSVTNGWQQRTASFYSGNRTSVTIRLFVETGFTGMAQFDRLELKKTELGEESNTFNGNGKVDVTEGYFTWDNTKVDYKTLGAVTKGGLISTPAINGDFEIVTMGASHGGDTTKLINVYFNEDLMRSQGFVPVGISGHEDKKVEMWIRKNNGQTSIDIPDDGKAGANYDHAYCILVLDGNDVQLELGNTNVEGLIDGGSPYKVPQIGGTGLKILSYFSDDSVQLLDVGLGQIIYHDWGFGDGDGLAVVLYAPSEQLPANVPVDRKDSGGFQYVGISTYFPKQ